MTLRALISCDHPAGLYWQAGDVRELTRIAHLLPPGPLPWWLLEEPDEAPTAPPSLPLSAPPTEPADPVSTLDEGQE